MTATSDLEDERVPTKRISHIEHPTELQKASTSIAARFGVASTSSTLHPGELKRTSPASSVASQHQPQRIREHNSVPEVLSNPLWLPSTSALIIPQFTAQLGIQVKKIPYPKHGTKKIYLTAIGPHAQR